jgi:hypothetical protein
MLSRNLTPRRWNGKRMSRIRESTLFSNSAAILLLVEDNDGWISCVVGGTILSNKRFLKINNNFVL